MARPWWMLEDVDKWVQDLDDDGVYGVFPDCVDSATGRLRPWWLRSVPPTPNVPVRLHRGYFTEAYPSLLPYFPMYHAQATWIDPWSMQPYHGYWSI